MVKVRTGQTRRIRADIAQRLLALDATRLPRDRPVSAPEVIAHVRSLRRTGVPLAVLATAAEVSERTVRRIDAGRVTALSPQVADRLLTLTPFTVALPDTALIDAAGMHRRLQALAAIGWPRWQIARHAGLPAADSLPGPAVRKVTWATARRVAQVYVTLADQPGPSDRTRAYARRRGWLPPAAWDDYLLDDPGHSAVAG